MGSSEPSNAPTTPPTLNRRTSFSPVYVTDGHPAAVRIAVKLLDANDQPINPNLTQSQDAQEATNEPLCDVIGIHPYGHSWLTIDTMIFDAQHINPDPSASSIPQSGTFHKQVYCSEAGYPGAGMSYVDAIGYCRNAWQTKRDGTPLQGVGYCPWMLMTGAIGERLPYGEGTGFFFTTYENPNGTIRAKDEWLAVHTHARTQGAPGLFAQGAAPPVMTINFQWPIPADIDSSAYYAHGGGFFEPTAAPGSLTPWPPNAAIQGMDYWTLESHLALLGELTDWFSFESSSFASNNGNPWLGYQGVPYRLEAADAIKLLHPEFGYAEVFNPRKKPGGIAAFSPFPNPPVYSGWELGKWLIEANSAGTIPHGTFAPEDPANPNQAYHLWHLKWYAQDWVNHLDRYINAETTGRAVIH